MGPQGSQGGTEAPQGSQGGTEAPQGSQANPQAPAEAREEGGAAAPKGSQEEGRVRGDVGGRSLPALQADPCTEVPSNGLHGSAIQVSQRLQSWTNKEQEQETREG